MKKYKRGDKREDGMIFWQYDSPNKERWLTEEKYKEVKDRVSMYSMKYREKHSEKAKQTTKDWYYKNREYAIAYNSTQKSERRKSDVIYRLKCNLSRSINRSIKNMGYPKNSRSIKVLGCDWNTFKNHIESFFKKGMTWDNYGEWHIDHAIPLRVAKTENQIKSLNHHTNLRPLWSKENLSKNDNITFEALLWTFCRKLNIKDYYSNHQYV